MSVVGLSQRATAAAKGMYALGAGRFLFIMKKRKGLP